MNNVDVALSDQSSNTNQHSLNKWCDFRAGLSVFSDQWLTRWDVIGNDFAVPVSGTSSAEIIYCSF